MVQLQQGAPASNVRCVPSRAPAQVYAGGQGDLRLSLDLIGQQLEIYPAFPSMHHDLATARVMVSELEEPHCGLAALRVPCWGGTA